MGRARIGRARMEGTRMIVHGIKGHRIWARMKGIRMGRVSTRGVRIIWHRIRARMRGIRMQRVRLKGARITGTRMIVVRINWHSLNCMGPWWWSNGQCARLLLRRSKFESRWSLKFLFCKLFEKDENKQKEAGNGPSFNSLDFLVTSKFVWHLGC